MRLVLALAALTGLAACHANADATPADTETRGFPVTGPIHAVDLRGSDDVHVVPGPLSVRASGPRDVLDHLDIHVDNGRLVVQRRGTTYSTRGAKVTVTVPAIDAAALDGSGELVIDRVAGQHFAGALGGSGDLTIGALTVAEAAFDIRGSGDVRATGQVRSLTVAASGSGDIELDKLRTDRATLAVHGSGGVSLGAAGTVTGASSGSGDVSVGGHPRCTIAKSGSGDVTCG